jgi:hypothetical protein
MANDLFPPLSLYPSLILGEGGPKIGLQLSLGIHVSISPPLCSCALLQMGLFFTPRSMESTGNSQSCPSDHSLCSALPSSPSSSSLPAVELNASLIFSVGGRGGFNAQAHDVVELDLPISCSIVWYP